MYFTGSGPVTLKVSFVVKTLQHVCVTLSQLGRKRLVYM